MNEAWWEEPIRILDRFWWLIIILILAVFLFVFVIKVPIRSDLLQPMTSVSKTQAEIDAVKGVVINNEDGFTLTFYPGSLSQNTKVQVERFKNTGNRDIQNLVFVGDFYDVDIGGAEIIDTTSITIPYDRTNIPDNVSEADLTIGYFSEEIKQWVSLPSQINYEEQTVTSPASHFSISTIFAGKKNENQSPIINDLRIEPNDFYVDCKQAGNQEWLDNQPFMIKLKVTDPDGIDDIQSIPEIKTKVDRWATKDTNHDYTSMAQTGPGQYEYPYRLTWQGMESIYKIFFPRCGDVRTVKFTVRVKDQKGNITERSTILYVRYSPIPTITLLDPLGEENTFTTPTFNWTAEWPVGVQQIYQHYTMELSKNASLSGNIITEFIPLDQNSYELPQGTVLEPGTRYFWQLKAYKNGTDWGFVKSQIETFVVDETGESEPVDPDDGTLPASNPENEGDDDPGVDPACDLVECPPDDGSQENPPDEVNPDGPEQPPANPPVEPPDTPDEPEQPPSNPPVVPPANPGNPDQPAENMVEIPDVFNLPLIDAGKKLEDAGFGHIWKDGVNNDVATGFIYNQEPPAHTFYDPSRTVVIVYRNMSREPQNDPYGCNTPGLTPEEKANCGEKNYVVWDELLQQNGCQEGSRCVINQNERRVVKEINFNNGSLELTVEGSSYTYQKNGQNQYTSSCSDCNWDIDTGELIQGSTCEYVIQFSLQGFTADEKCVLGSDYYCESCQVRYHNSLMNGGGVPIDY